MSILQNPNLKNIKLAKPRERRVSAAHGLRFISSLCFLKLSLLSHSLIPCSTFPGGGDDWASGGSIYPIFAQPFAGDERILQVCPPLLFPSAVRDGAPQTLTKLFVFGSESSYNKLPTNFVSFARTIGRTCVNPFPMLGPPLVHIGSD